MPVLSKRTKEAMEVLEIEYPFSTEDLKNRLKAEMDSGGKNSPQRVLTLTESFNILQSLSSDYEAPKTNTIKLKMVDENTPEILVEKCPVCRGDKKIRKFVRKELCTACTTSSETRKYELRDKYRKQACKFCTPPGSGKYKLRSGREVDCERCKGTPGIYQPVCKKCGNERVILIYEEIPCYKCSGKGYLNKEVFNPALPKEALMAT